MRCTILPLVVIVGCGQDYEVSGPLEVDPADVTECAFVPVSGTQFQRYDCNPVFSSSDEPWIAGGVGSVGFRAEEVLGHPFYQMWYSTVRVDGNYGLGYATSPDGTVWTPLAANPVFQNPDGGFNRDAMGALSIVWDGDNDQYVLAYQGVNFDTDGNGLGMLTSPDGQAWTEENDGAPFLDLSAELNNIEYCFPMSLTWESGIGLRGYITGGPPGSTICQVYTYSGADLASLAFDAQVVLPAGPNPYDIEGIANASVVKLGATYYMFYTGIAGWQPLEGTNFITPFNTQLGIATSADGLTWEKSTQNPIEQVALVTPSRMSDVAAQVVGPRIHLWITDYYEELDGSAVGYFLYEPDQPYHP